MERLTVEVRYIVYQNNDNGYTVLSGRAQELDRKICAVGYLPPVKPLDTFIFTGEWVDNKKYGKQFSFTMFETVLPHSLDGIRDYLSSGIIKGIGKKNAERIIEHFGLDTLRVIAEEWERLTEVPHIGKKRAEKIREGWLANRGIENIAVFLSGFGIPMSYIIKIYRRYREKSIAVIQKNPYQLADDIWGFGFRTADLIADRLGFGKDRPERLRSGILYELKGFSTEGHCFLPRQKLVAESTSLLTVPAELISVQIDVMAEAGDIVLEESSIYTAENMAVYLPMYYNAETGIARRLRNLNFVSARAVEPDIALAAAGQVSDYEEHQKEAIRTAVEEKITVITGGPGTGKTTTVAGIIAAFRHFHFNVRLAAPTGRAAKRMKEVVSEHMKNLGGDTITATTIHRLLEAGPPSDKEDGDEVQRNGFIFARNEQNPIDGDVLIVDECSMLDATLTYSLLRAVPDTMRVILVGDIDQLPSVGAGNVLHDIIASGEFSVIRLTKVFRQAESSRIITNAHKVNHGIVPDIESSPDSDFWFIDATDFPVKKDGPVTAEDAVTAYAADTIVRLVDTLPKQYESLYGKKIGICDIQVLSPMRKTDAGVVELNRRIQAVVNPTGESVTRNGYTFRTGDKVMQIRNNYDKGVYNGDVGIVIGLNTVDQEMTVRYDKDIVVYDFDELEEVVLAYACTIHKSQGSEYPIVVMPILPCHWIMLQRNLLYTGITRAKKLLVMVGTKKALRQAVANIRIRKRHTMLKEKIQQSMKE